MQSRNHSLSDKLGGTWRQSSWCRWLIAIGLIISCPSVADAHPTRELWQGSWWTAWQWDGLVMANLIVLGIVYGWGWRAAVIAASRRQRAAFDWRLVGRGIAFVFALLAIGIALQSPLDLLGESLGWVHMLQHMTLMTIAAPLAVVGRPVLMFAWALPRAMRSNRRVQRAMRGLWGTRNRRLWCNVWFALILHAATMWGWHYPLLYEAALNDPLVHDIEHLSMFAAAVIFWEAVLASVRNGGASSTPAVRVVALFVTSVLGMGLGVLMALSPEVLVRQLCWQDGSLGLDAAGGSAVGGDDYVDASVCGVSGGGNLHSATLAGTTGRCPASVGQETCGYRIAVVGESECQEPIACDHCRIFSTQRLLVRFDGCEQTAPRRAITSGATCCKSGKSFQRRLPARTSREPASSILRLKFRNRSTSSQSNNPFPSL